MALYTGSEHLRAEVDEGVAVITMNRPSRSSRLISGHLRRISQPPGSYLAHRRNPARSSHRGFETNFRESQMRSISRPPSDTFGPNRFGPMPTRPWRRWKPARLPVVGYDSAPPQRGAVLDDQVEECVDGVQAAAVNTDLPERLSDD